MENYIELEKVVKKYKTFTLDEVTFNVPVGKIVGFIGENGSGKSTTMKAIVDLIRIDSGTIKVFGKNIKELTSREREEIGVVLDEVCLPEKLTVEKLNLIFKDIFIGWDNTKFLNFLSTFGIDINKKIKDLSKGMKAKLNLAIAFSHSSKIVILDEPMNGLDPVARDEVMEIIEDFTSDSEHSVLISSHIISDLEKICDYVVFIHNGKVFLQDEKRTLLNKFEILELTDEEFKHFDKMKIIRYKKLGDTYTVFMNKGSVVGSEKVKPVSLEDIMIFMIRGKML